MEDQLNTVGILGASGFLGRALSHHLVERGWRVIRFSRNPPSGEDDWRAMTPLNLEGLQAVINLAGESIAQRWTARKWEKIVDSRVGLTKSLVATWRAMTPEVRPAALLNASAVGIYPSSGDHVLPESAAPGSGRMGALCRDWEAAAVEAEEFGVRVVRLRTGIVLGRDGEAWTRLHRIFRMGVGGRLGNGHQWFPWVHLADELAAITFALENSAVVGPVNLCAPEVVTNRQFTTTLARTLKRPALCHAPGVALRLLLGGFGQSLLASYRMVPERLRKAGFAFQFPTLEGALKDLLR